MYSERLCAHTATYVYDHTPYVKGGTFHYTCGAYLETATTIPQLVLCVRVLVLTTFTLYYLCVVACFVKLHNTSVNRKGTIRSIY